MALKQPIGLIAVDLDNTLLRRDKSVSPYTLDILRQCQARGVQLAFATARSAAACARIASQALPNYEVTCGGALVCRAGVELARRVLPKEEANAILAYCRQLPSTGRILAEMASGVYYVSNEVDPAAVGDYTHARQYQFTNPLQEGVLKLVVQVQDEADRAAALHAFAHLEVHNYVGTKWVFFGAAGATKWHGLLDVAADMGIGPQNIVAFGDDTGDVEMLQNSGLGVAMENTLPGIKAIANTICPDCDADGVAWWLWENMLQENKMEDFV